MKTFASVVALLAACMTMPASASKSTGTICVAPLPANAAELDRDYPDGKAPREYRYEFTVQVGSKQQVPVDARKPILIEGLPLRKTHVVRIRDAGRPIESFRFTFASRGGAHLCLRYTPWYQTWQLDRRNCGCAASVGT